MGRKYKITVIRCVFWAFVASGLAFMPTSLIAAETPSATLVLASTFPIYQITRNVVQGSQAIQVELLMPASLGCPHDYTVTPQDMHRLTKADGLVINGLGMEKFLDSLLKKAPLGLKIMDSSTGITDLIKYQRAYANAHKHHKHDEHGQEELNPHLFASSRMSAMMAENIARYLSELDPASADIYRKNSLKYGDEMRKLSLASEALGKQLKNRRVVMQHDAFAYFARDIGLEIVAVLQVETEEPSAAKMLELVKTIKTSGAVAIFTEPQFSDRIAKTIAKEAGIKVAVLNPVATGPKAAPLDYYAKVMQENLETLAAILGEK